MHSALIYEVQKAVVDERLRAANSIRQPRVRRPRQRFALAIRRRPARADLELHKLATAEGVNR